VENNDVGEHEDDDVRTERQKVADILSNWNAKPPVVVVQVICYCVITLGMVIIENMSSRCLLLYFSSTYGLGSVCTVS
jgi:hypothetical protein